MITILCGLNAWRASIMLGVLPRPFALWHACDTRQTRTFTVIEG
jgi:hypothetical protein